MLKLKLMKTEVLFPFNFRHVQNSLRSVIFETSFHVNLLLLANQFSKYCSLE